MSIQLITFDLDDTLWDVTPVMQDAEAALRNWLAMHAPRLGAVPVEHLWTIRAGLLQAEAGFQVFLAARHQVELFAEVHPTLETLANRFQLGVITNGNADVRRLGLADYFQFALCAEELGVGKPDPKPFQ